MLLFAGIATPLGVASACGTMLLANDASLFRLEGLLSSHWSASSVFSSAFFFLPPKFKTRAEICVQLYAAVVWQFCACKASIICVSILRLLPCVPVPPAPFPLPIVVGEAAAAPEDDVDDATITESNLEDDFLKKMSLKYREWMLCP